MSPVTNTAPALSTECPECAASVAMNRRPLTGEVVRCTDCRAELEVTSLSPFYLVTMAALLLTIWLGDHPRLTGSVRRQQLLLDRALTDEDALREHLAELLGARIVGVAVVRTDLVNDTTLVDVRYEPGAAAQADVRSIASRAVA